MKKILKELHDAIKSRINTLKSEVINTYESIFDEIETRKKELKIEEGNITSNPEYHLQKINKESQIAQLEIFQLKAKSFKSDNIKILEDVQIVNKEREGKYRILSLNKNSLKLPLQWISYYSDFWNDSFDKLDKLINTQAQNDNNN